MFKNFKRVGRDPRHLPGIGSNLVRNAGAEEGSEDWLFDNLFGEGDYTASIADVGAHSGSKSLRIECTGKPGQAARWYMKIPVTPGKAYTGSFWIRASDGAYGRLEIASSPRAEPVGWADSRDEWTRIVVPQFSVAPTCSSVTIYATSNGGGTVHFDDFFIAEVPEIRHAVSGQEK